MPLLSHPRCLRLTAAMPLLLLASLLLVACGADPSPVAQTTVAPQATATPAPSSTPTDTDTPTPLPSHTPTFTPSPTATSLPGASLLAYETYGDGNGEIYVLDTSTGKAANLTRHPADDRAPAWRPDGGAIAFESHRDGNWELYVLELSTGVLHRITEDLAYDGAPSWSPDGTQIAFESYRDGNLEIYVTNLETGQIRRLTADPAGDYGPSWSPDGLLIAFTSWRDGNKEIYVAPALEGAPRNLSQHAADDEQPAWAPDGSSLAFVSWRGTNPQTGSRNADIFRINLETGQAERMTDGPWPDVDPAWNWEGKLVWAGYDPGPAFETYDPYRPGDYHLYQASASGPQHLTYGEWDDRHPAPAPLSVASLDGLTGRLPPPAPSGEATALAKVVEVPAILVGYSEQPIQVNELVAPSLVAWQQDVLAASGWDFVHKTLGSWRNIDQVRKKELYTYDYGYLSWHKAGRALDLALEYKVDGVDQLLLTREDLGEQVYWRMYLRTSKQDGTMGEPLKDNPWLFWWHIVPEQNPEAYDAGGKRLPIPEGYYADITSLAKRNGWERIACYAIEGDYHWKTDSNGTEYWHYERTDDLVWWDAMLQLYPLETLEQHVGWDEGLRKAQSEAMMLSKGIPTPGPQGN